MDVVQLLSDSVDVKDYIKKMKKRDSELNANWGTICPLVEMTAADGKRRKVQAANAQGRHLDCRDFEGNFWNKSIRA